MPKFLKILLIPIFILTSYSAAQEYSSSYSSSNIIDLTTNKWQYRLGDSSIDSSGKLTRLYDSLDSSEWKSVKTFREIPLVSKGKYIWVRTVLPYWDGSNASIYVDDVQQAMQVYLDSKKIYQFGNFDPVVQHIPYGFTVHLIPLSENFQGKTLSFRIYSSTDKVALFKTVKLGRSFNLTQKLFFTDIDEFILASIYIVAGIIIFFSFIFLRRNKLLLGLSIFLMAAGIWTGSNSQFLQLILKHPYLFYVLDNISVSSFAIGPLIIAENIIDTKYKKILRRLWQLNVIYLFASIIIELIPGTSFADIFNYYLIILFVLTIISVTVMALSAIKGNYQTKLLLLGFGISSFCGILEILLFTSESGAYSPTFIHFGSAALVIMLVWILFNDYKVVYEQKEIAQKQVLDVIQLEKETRRKYTQKLLTLREEEHKRISLELHDSVGQELLIAKNLISFGKKKKINIIENDKYYKTIYNSTSKAIDEVRDISHTLHPVQLEKLGLTQAISSLVKRCEKSLEISFSHKADNIDGILNSENEIHLYRIVQESLNNIIKHSEANAANISIAKSPDKILLSIKDNGKGFDTNKVKDESIGLGLTSISERASLLNGKLKINSEINKGTEIVISLKI